ncbi:MAG: PD-(D/E)XK nuclease family protein [bacterium]
MNKPGYKVVVSFADKYYREVEEIGRQTRKLLKQVVPIESIGMGMRDLSRYGPIITDVFNRYRIPLSFRRGNPITLNPALKAALIPLSVIKTGFDSRELLRLFRSGYFRLEKGDLLKELFERAGVVKGDGDYYRKSIGRFLESGKDTARFENVFQSLNACLELLEGLDGSRSLRDFVDDYRRLLKHFGFLDRQLDSVKRDVSCLQAFEVVLDELSEGSAGFWGKESVAFLRFCDLLTFLLNKVTALNETASCETGVRVFNLLDLVGMKFGYLFIGGLKEGKYPPSSSKNQTPEDWERERSAFYLGLSAAEKSLFLSYWGEEEEDDQSLFLREFLDTYKGKIERRNVPRSLTDLDYHRVYQDFELEAKLVHDYQLDFPDPAAEALFAERKKSPDFSRVLEVVLPNLERTEKVSESNRISQKIIDRFSDERFFSISPTSLEMYAQCPRKFFLNKIMEIPGFYPADWEADPLAEGNLIHRIMEKCGRLTAGFLEAGSSKESLTEWWKETVTRELEEGKNREGRGDYRLREVQNRLATERILHSLRSDLDRLLEEGLKPVWFERPFRINTGIRLDFGKELVLKGKIDRLDKSEHKLTVIDYKNSRAGDYYRKRIRREKLDTLQLPVYLLAALIENQKGIDSLEAGFLLVKNGEFVRFSTDSLKKNTWPLEDLKTFLGFKEGKLKEDNLLGQIKTYVQRIARGDFPPTPEPDICKLCDYRFVCQFSDY